MGIKKLTYIILILLLSILHTITLSFWLSTDDNIVENKKIENTKDGDVVAATSETNNLSE